LIELRYLKILFGLSNLSQIVEMLSCFIVLVKLNQIHSKGIYLQTQEAIANMLDRIIKGY